MLYNRTSSVPRKSLAIFGNLRHSSENVRKMSGDVRQVFGTILENLRKSLESGRKSSESRQKRLYNKQTIVCLHVEVNFIFSYSTRYLTRSLRSLVRYRVEHLTIKFISTRRHIISSIYFIFTVIINF